MWAVIGKDSKTVIDIIRPDVEYEEALKEVTFFDFTLVEVTIENSPCYVKGVYENGKFYPPEEIKHLYYETEKNWLPLR